MNAILIMELVVGLILSFIVLGFVIWGVKTGQFDDGKKQSDGLLFDTTDDLNDAIDRENRLKKAKLKENL